MKKIIISLSVLFMAAGCGRNKPVDMAGEEKETAKVETVKLEKGNLSSVIKMPGELKPFEKVDIYPKVNGFVKDVLVDRGSLVKTGQTLMTLEAPELDQQLQAAQAKLLETTEMLNASRDRYYRLLSASKTTGAVSDLDLMNASSKYQADSAMQQAQTANVSSVRTLKDYLVVRAPFDGVITERNIHPGTLTGPNFKMDNKPLLVLQNNLKLRLEVFVPEEYSSKLDLSTKKMSFTSTAMPGKIFEADIARQSNSLYDDYRSEAIEADVNNSNGVFKPGMYVEAEMKVKSDVISFAVPSSAIITSTEGKYIALVKDNKVHLVHVKEGISDNQHTEIFGDLSGDEAVIKFGNNEMKEGMILK